jgi:hypothetical protein
LLETPLDKIEPYGMFKHVFMGMRLPLMWYIALWLTSDSLLGLQQEQPQLYENLTKILSPEEQQIIQAVFHEADAKAMAAANAEAAGVQANGTQ